MGWTTLLRPLLFLWTPDTVPISGLPGAKPAYTPSVSGTFQIFIRYLAQKKILVQAFSYWNFISEILRVYKIFKR